MGDWQNILPCEGGGTHQNREMQRMGKLAQDPGMGVLWVPLMLPWSSVVTEAGDEPGTPLEEQQGQPQAPAFHINHYWGKPGEKSSETKEE